jgi:pyruvate/2-oxoglutarate dehydrogenase complex dihydrolipoamide dehydrogenase (E3) component
MRDPNSKLHKPDLCILGAGLGGIRLALRAAEMGLRVTLVERGAIGGAALHKTAVPSQALLYAARSASHVFRGSRFGVYATELQIDTARVRESIDAAITRISAFADTATLEKAGIHVVKAEAKFIDSRTVQADDWTLQAKNFVIATGGKSHAPMIPGLHLLNVVTPEEILARSFQTDHLLILGGGPVAAEIGEAQRALGTQVTIISQTSFLPREDTELSGILKRKLQADGLQFIEDAYVLRAEDRGGNPALILSAPNGQERVVVGSEIVLACGREPALADLDLESAKIVHSNKGVATDHWLKTSNRRIFAIGDARGGQGGVAAALQDADLVFTALTAKHHPFRLRRTPTKPPLPRCTFTDPELAQIGLTEEDAKRVDPKAQIIRIGFAGIAKAAALGQRGGLLKLIVSSRWGWNGPRLLGVGIVGPGAGELIGLWSLVITGGLPLSSLARTPLPFPTLNDISRQAASQALALRPKTFLARLRALFP